MRFDDTEIPALLPTIGYVDYAGYGPDGISDLMLMKLGRSADPQPTVDKAAVSARDREMLEAFYPCFDRYAFKDPMCIEEHVSFIEAIRETKIALAHGRGPAIGWNHTSHCEAEGQLRLAEASSGF